MSHKGQLAAKSLFTYRAPEWFNLLLMDRPGVLSESVEIFELFSTNGADIVYL